MLFLAIRRKGNTRTLLPNYLLWEKSCWVWRPGSPNVNMPSPHFHRHPELAYASSEFFKKRHFPKKIPVVTVMPYFTIPAAFANTTCDNTAVSVFAGKCEQKPIPA